MTATGQLIGHGAQLELQVGSSWTSILGLLSGDFGSDKVDALDTTDMGTAGITRVFTGGLENPGDFSAKLNYLPGDTTQAALYTAKDGTVHNFKFLDEGGTHYSTFSGIITSIDKTYPDDKLVTMSLKIQISGPVVLT